MLTFRPLPAIAEVPAGSWDALLGDRGAPFLEWTFLHILEASGCAAADQGWTPQHLTLWRGERLVAAAPAYLKSHSFGEFAYNDFRWPAVAAHFNVLYYPKLVVCIPFNPCTGPRALVAEGEDRAQCVAALARGAQELARAKGWSSVHVLFPDDADLAPYATAGFAPGAGLQFHWRNRGYRSFDDFLERFGSKRRAQIRRERARAAKDGTVISTRTGAALTPDLMAFVARCYAANVDKHAPWSQHHLNPRFFQMAGERLAHRVEVALAEEAGRPIAAAFNLAGEDRLYGRQWGAVEERPFLHFHVCLYHAVERCIARGISAFEPGAGGEHKYARGFESTRVHSAHWFADERLGAAMRKYLPREVAAVEEEIARARRLSPLRR